MRAGSPSRRASSTAQSAGIPSRCTASKPDTKSCWHKGGSTEAFWSPQPAEVLPHVTVSTFQSRQVGVARSASGIVTRRQVPST